MKKIFIAAIFLMALLIGSAFAEKFSVPEKSYDPDSPGATAAPADINHADSIYFPRIDYYNMTSTDSRIILTHYPTYQQMTEYSCGPSCALTVLYYYGNRDFDEETLVKLMKTEPRTGTSLGNMVNFFKSIGWNVSSRLDTPPFENYNAFKKFITSNLNQGKPIIVENVDYGGHWRVIIGYDTIGTENLYDDVLIFANPFDTSDHNQNGYSIESFDKFFSMWFDHCMLPQNERHQPWLIATPRRT